MYKATWPNLGWSDVSLPNGNDTCFGISSYDGTNVIAVGTTGSIFYSSNSGSHWSASASGTSSVIYNVAHGSSSVAIAAGQDNFVARTTDGGTTWTTVTVFSNAATIIRYRSVSFISALEVYIAGTVDSGGEIYKSIDGGETWTFVTSTSHPLYSISMLNSLKGVAGSDAIAGVYTLVPSK